LRRSLKWGDGARIQSKDTSISMPDGRYPASGNEPFNLPDTELLEAEKREKEQREASDEGRADE